MVCVAEENDFQHFDRVDSCGIGILLISSQSKNKQHDGTKENHRVGPV